MSKSKSLTIIAVTMTLGFVLPSLCFGLLAVNITAGQTMPGDCHGQGSIPHPSHSCCYAAHQIPATGSTLAPSLDVACLGDGVSTLICADRVNDSALISQAKDSSPPGYLVLRI